MDVRVGGFDLGDLFAGETRWEPALPELVFALDFSLGLGGWGIKEADVIELERPAELGERLGVLREKDGVIIDVDLQRTAVDQEGGRKEIEVGQEKFPIIEFGTDEQAAAIVEHIKHGKVQRAAGEPAMGRGVQLPEFADLRALPASHRGVWALGRGRMGQTVFNGPVADLGAVELEGVESQGFRGGEAVGARRGASQTLFKKVGDRLRPGGGVITARSSRDPQTLFLACAGAEVIGGESVEATAGDVEFFGRIGRCQGAPSEAGQHMADEGSAMPVGQLLVLFKSTRSDLPIPLPSPFVGLRYAPALLKDWAGGCDPQHLTEEKCPGLLTTDSVLVCFTRDSPFDC